ncbi:pyridoxal phosphate-dependent aminotransferase [Solicola gregarius]|uniref:Pyridoxal phosphate-dependent aminotransferase n=1 Tax=Solicola gregarius TaxID=2908642 RepID=A0AA46TDT8_9ACTN|nr:pyridoxal phosphate-dependent aminotransferase [Solicola gregarius]UYM03472.1 pyridoxal phosphate-dependent aminotransferase [Solicola gregarius]
MKERSQRTQGMGTTIFARMSQLAVETESVNLGQGFPDTDGPAYIIDAAIDAMHGGRNQYAPGPGAPDLRHAIARHQRRFYDIDLDPDTEIAVSAGATEAIAAAVLGLIDPGDEVLVLEPYYDSYVAVMRMADAVRKPITLRPPDFRLDVDRLRASVTPRTTAMLINSPHNPTGMVLNAEERAAIAEVAVEHDLVVITDEVYEHLTYDGSTHVPLATLPGMAERTLTISSGGKTFSLTGWKIGWATGPAALVQAMLSAKQFMTYTSGAPLQPAIAVALDSPDSYYTELSRRMQDQRDRLCDGLASAGLHTYVPAGGYFVTTDITSVGFDDGIEFCLGLPERAGVVAVPYQVFYDDPGDARTLVRWAFSKRPAVLDEGIARLRKAFG